MPKIVAVTNGDFVIKRRRDASPIRTVTEMLAIVRHRLVNRHGSDLTEERDILVTGPPEQGLASASTKRRQHH